MRSTDPSAIIAGLIFIGLAGVFLLEALDVWDVRAVVPLGVMLVGLGVAIVAGALWRSDRARAAESND